MARKKKESLFKDTAKTIKNHPVTAVGAGAGLLIGGLPGALIGGAAGLLTEESSHEKKRSRKRSR